MTNAIQCHTFPKLTMPETDAILSTRISPRIKLAAERQSKRDELSLSDVTRMLLKAYAKGDIKISVSQ
ncbi:hypothetical protein HN801_04370 [Candidatus Peregrinibacteria bacterium]|jgi:hypothetical protein|nr:hypothetical protein [Candidatus Peregrinibacteria bacterium]